MKATLFSIGLVLALLLPVQVFATDRALNCSIDSTNVDAGGRVVVTVELDNTSTAFGGPLDSTNVEVDFIYGRAFQYFNSSPSPDFRLFDFGFDDSLFKKLVLTVDSLPKGAVKSIDIEFRALLGGEAGPKGLSGKIISGTPDDPVPGNNNCQLFVNVIKPNAPGSAGNLNNDGSVRDPISSFSGEFYNQFDPDLDLGGPMVLAFSRYYGSMMLAEGVPAGVLGNNWLHNFEWSLLSSDTAVTIFSNKGALLEFTKEGALWNQTGFANKKYQLVEDGGSGTFVLLDVINQRFYTFSTEGLLTSVSDGRGNQHSLTYDGSNRLSQASDGVGRIFTYTYTGDKLTTVSDGTRTVIFTHTDNDLTGSTSPLGFTTTYTYAADGLMTSSTRPGGNTFVAQIYDGDGKVTSQTDGNGNTTNLSYSIDNITTITDAMSATTIHTHTETGELALVEDANGNVISITSNDEGLRSSVTDRLGEATSLTYHTPSNKLATRTDPDNGLTSYFYTDRIVSGFTLYDRTGITHADGSTESMVYDAAGNLISRTDQLGNAFTHTYNGVGQRLSSSFPIGGTTANTYNADSTLASVTDPMGNTTSFTYDALKRPSGSTSPDGSTRSFTFDNANRILTITDENNNTTGITYDNNDNLESITTALGETTTFTYNDNDQPISITDPLGSVVNTTYNALGLVATYEDAGGNVTTNGYDVLGQLTTVTDPLGNVWATSYNLEGVVASRTNPLGHSTTFTADELGRVTQIASPLGHANEIAYDLIGLISSTVDPLGNVTYFDRDATGFIKGIELDEGAVSTTYTRNEIGQLLSAEDPNGNHWDNTYDIGGRLTSQTDPLGNTGTLGYNNRNRVSVVNYPSGLGTLTVGYDDANNTTSRIYSDGTTLTYTYDANNRLLTADGISNTYDANGRNINSNGIATDYDARGLIESTTLAPGKVVTYGYDANERLVSVTDWIGGVTAFGYDVAGNRTTITRPNGVNRSNSFDADSRLIAVADGTDLTITLVRDGNDQIVSANRTAPMLATAKSVNDIDNNFDAASQVASHSYDALGRTTTAGNNSFTWNLASRLISMTRNGVTTTATYDGLGSRLSRTVGAVTINYVWNYALRLPSIVIEKHGSNDSRYFIRTPDGELLYSIDAATNDRSFYHFDEMGNTVYVSNDAGTTIGSYAYSPFGVLNASSGELDNPFTWQGKMGAMDEGDGLYYIRARYYDAVSARFISRDPVQNTDPGLINPYQYALNNPLKYVDVTGRLPAVLTDTGGLISAVADIPGLGVFINSANLIDHAISGDGRSAIDDGLSLAVDAGGYFLAGAAATAEAGAITGATIATPVVVVYSAAKVGIVVYDAWWDLEAAQQRLEATKFAGELNRKKQERIQAEKQAKIAEESRIAHEKSEQREQKFRDENKAREKAEAKGDAAGETAKAAKFLFN